MPLPIAGQVGPSAVNGQDGSNIEVRQGHTGEIIIQQLHGRYAEASLRGLMFSAANQAAQAVSAALATAYTGLLLYNPIGSGKVLVPNKIKFALAAAPAAAATIGLISGVQTSAPTGLTSVPVRSSQIGNASAGAGVAYAVATIATPVWTQQLYDAFTAAAFPAPTLPVDLEGAFVILPGGFIAIGALTAINGLGSIVWEELPYNING